MLSLQLTTYSLVKSGKGVKKTLVLKKDVGVKTKQIEFTFIAKEDNYLEFQNAILHAYGFQMRFKANSKHFFLMKIHIPPKKYVTCFSNSVFTDRVFRLKEAPDVENCSEYVELTRYIVKEQPHKDVTILIDMQKIESCCKVRGQLDFNFLFYTHGFVEGQRSG